MNGIAMLQIWPLLPPVFFHLLIISSLIVIFHEYMDNIRYVIVVCWLFMWGMPYRVWVTASDYRFGIFKHCLQTKHFRLFTIQLAGAQYIWRSIFGKHHIMWLINTNYICIPHNISSFDLNIFYWWITYYIFIHNTI